MILNTNELDAVIFDLDGTLFDSMSMWKTRFSQRRPATYGLLDLPQEEVPLYAKYYK